MLLRVLGPVDADHRVRRREHEFGERLGEKRLAGPTGADEEERRDRTVLVPETTAREADRICDGLDCFGLADDLVCSGLVAVRTGPERATHALGEDLLHAKQLLAFGRLEALDRDAGPVADDNLDRFLGDRVAAERLTSGGCKCCLLGALGLLERLEASLEVRKRVVAEVGSGG